MNLKNNVKIGGKNYIIEQYNREEFENYLINNVDENEIESLREKISSLTTDNLHLREKLKNNDIKIFNNFLYDI